MKIAFFCPIREQENYNFTCYALLLYLICHKWEQIGFLDAADEKYDVWLSKSAA